MNNPKSEQRRMFEFRLDVALAVITAILWFAFGATGGWIAAGLWIALYVGSRLTRRR